MSLTGSRFSSDSAPRALPSWGFEDEVEQSFGRPCRQCDGRFKRTYELTSSIVPRETSFHRGVELDFLLLHWILHRSQAAARDCLKVPEAGWYIDGDTKGQRDHRPDTWGRHQAAAHIIVPDDNQQAAMQDAELLANYPPDNEQRFHQHCQIGKVLDKLPNMHLVLDRPDHADLETEVAQGGTQVVLDGNGLRLKQLAMGQQHSKLLTA